VEPRRGKRRARPEGPSRTVCRGDQARKVEAREPQGRQKSAGRETGALRAGGGVDVSPQFNALAAADMAGGLLRIPLKPNQPMLRTLFILSILVPGFFLRLRNRY